MSDYRDDRMAWVADLVAGVSGECARALRQERALPMVLTIRFPANFPSSTRRKWCVGYRREMKKLVAGFGLKKSDITVISSYAGVDSPQWYLSR